MSMISEMHAEIEAENLEKALLNAKIINNEDVNEYCKNNILPLYVKAVNKTYGGSFDNYESIIDLFNGVIAQKLIINNLKTKNNVLLSNSRL